MSQHENKGISVHAAMGAATVSMFVTCTAAILPFGLVYGFPDGILRIVALIVAGIVCLVFFLWFGKRAYKVELEFMEEKKNPV